MHKKLVLFLVGMGLLTMVCGTAMAADTVKIAYIDPLSGAFANVGDTGLKHFKYMAELINAKGGVLGGKKLEIVGFDNKTSANDSVIQLQNAIDQGIRFITQGNGSNVAGALIDAVNKHNERYPDKEVLYLNYAAVTPAFTNEGCSFWHFRFDAHADMKLAAITDYIKTQKNIKKVYLINMDYVFGHAVRDTSIAMLKAKRPDIQIVGNTLHPIGKVKDFSPYVAMIKASGADSVITGNWGNDMALLVKASKEAGLNVRYFTFYAGGLGTPSAIGAAGDGHVIQVTEWHNNLCVEEKKPDDCKFFLAYNEKYSDGGKNPFYYGRIRTTMEMLAKAFDKAGSTEAKAVAYALEGMQYQTPYGMVTMRAEDHQLIQPLYLSIMTKVGTKGVKYDVENTGEGWKTLARIEAANTAMPTTCKMKRPPK
ncbi:MAG: branched-chain amino acid ABC transporter substrate-binding protein [Thermodesulfobacteriota bacterium]